MCLENDSKLNTENFWIYLQAHLITRLPKTCLSVGKWPIMMGYCHLLSHAPLAVAAWSALLLLPDQGFVATFTEPIVLIKMAESPTICQRQRDILLECLVYHFITFLWTKLSYRETKKQSCISGNEGRKRWNAKGQSRTFSFWYICYTSQGIID